jgi:ubiquinone/menaquinone biosynthesis C-methylase UbiE
VSRPSWIRFLSSTARVYDPVARALGFRRLWRRIAELAAPAPGEAALDACSGTGGVASELARRGARAVAVDLASGMLRRARRSIGAVVGPVGSARVARMDTRRLAFRDASFPLVTCSMALHEMAEGEREEVLAELARVASGRVLVADYRVPASRVGRALFRLLRGYEYLEGDDFESFVRADPLRGLARAGLQAAKVADVGPYRIWICERITPRAAAERAPEPLAPAARSARRSRARAL